MNKRKEKKRGKEEIGRKVEIQKMRGKHITIFRFKNTNRQTHNVGTKQPRAQCLRKLEVAENPPLAVLLRGQHYKMCPISPTKRTSSTIR
jgi:hypothetical protein